MPTCERCGDAHATVNEAEWVNQSILLCPTCWEDCKAWVKSSRQAIERREKIWQENASRFASK